jgi:hypothetical protein
MNPREFSSPLSDMVRRSKEIEVSEPGSRFSAMESCNTLILDLTVFRTIEINVCGAGGVTQW